jgi:DNA-nicking Smr family endonuclease
MRRRLSSDEADLWNRVAQSVTPMHNRHLPLPEPEQPKAPPEPLKQPAQSRIPAFRLGERAAPAAAVPSRADALRMDARTHQKMTRGKLVPEARIDLHGMTLAEAHPELIRFVLNAQSEGLRLVLVITGKGKGVADPVPRPIGALRHQVPHWLRLPPLAPAVLQIAEAHLKHGGAGAFYVYLRRR